jgi:hypothetical protein
LTRRIIRIETEIHQAMSVMDAESRRLLNYKPLVQHQKYKGEWQVSSANEFGRVANGVGGRTT